MKVRKAKKVKINQVSNVKSAHKTGWIKKGSGVKQVKGGLKSRDASLQAWWGLLTPGGFGGAASPPMGSRGRAPKIFWDFGTIINSSELFWEGI